MSADTPQIIAQRLKGIDKYNPENLGLLEPYIEEQLSQGTYDLNANLSVLKLYQFNPSYFRSDKVCGILLKSLMNLPAADFTLCMSLVDPSQHEEPGIGRLLLLHHLLETCQFSNFWQEVAATPDLVEDVAGFENSIRSFICYTIAVSHQKISMNDLKLQMGDLNDLEVEAWIERSKWTVDDSGLVFVANQEESVKTRNIVEKVGFEDVHGVMSYAA